MHALLVLCAALLGLALGEIARRVVHASRYRRDGDEPRLGPARWAPLAGALVGALVAHTLSGRPAVALVALVALGPLLLLALVDLDVHRLPDALVRPLAAGLLAADAVAALWTRSWEPLAQGIGAGLALFVTLYVLAMVPSGFGYGDVKLAGALGLGLGPLGTGAVVAAPLLAVVLGGLGAVVLLVSGRATRHSHLAFGPALVAGALLAVCAYG